MRFWMALAPRNVLRNWRLSLASVLATAIALTTSSLISGYYRDVEGLFRDMYTRRQMIGDFLIEPQPPLKHIDAITQVWVNSYLRETAGVGPVSRFLALGGMASNGNTTAVFGGFGYDIGPGELLRGPRWRWNVLAGRPLANDAIPNNGVVAGRGFAEILGCSIPKGYTFLNDAKGLEAKERPFSCEFGNLFQLSVTTDAGRFNAVNARVSGIIDGGFREADMRLVMMPLETAQLLLNTSDVSYYSVATESEGLGHRIRDDFNRKARTGNVLVRAIEWERHTFGELFVRSMDMSSIFKNFISIVVLAVTGMSLLNTHVKAVHERTREIGMMRSMGFSRRRLLVLFGFEGALLGLLGSLLGGAVFAVVGSFVNLARIEYKAGMLSQPVLFRIALDPGIVVGFSSILLLLSVVSLLVPVWRVTRERISDSLTSV